MTSKAVFNYYLQQWVLGNVDADQLSELVTAGKLTQADSTEIQACTAIDWREHKR